MFPTFSGDEPENVMNWFFTVIDGIFFIAVLALGFYIGSLDASNNYIELQVWEIQRANELCKDNGGIDYISVSTNPANENIVHCDNGKGFGMNIDLNKELEDEHTQNK